MEGMIGEVRMFGGNFAPKSWAFCEGQLIPISQNTALFSILGTMYGGDGRTTFALPNLSGRVAVSSGQGPGLQDWREGEAQGSNTTTLTQSNLASHNHVGFGSLKVSANSGSTNTPVGNGGATAVGRNSVTGSGVQIMAYGTAPTSNMASDAAEIVLSNNGNNIPVNNMQPSLGMNYIICMFGVFPSRG